MESISEADIHTCGEIGCHFESPLYLLVANDKSDDYNECSFRYSIFWKDYLKVDYGPFSEELDESCRESRDFIGRSPALAALATANGPLAARMDCKKIDCGERTLNRSNVLPSPKSQARPWFGRRFSESRPGQKASVSAITSSLRSRAIPGRVSLEATNTWADVPKRPLCHLISKVVIWYQVQYRRQYLHIRTLRLVFTDIDEIS